MMNIIAGVDGYDSTTATVDVPDYLNGIEKDIKGMRIGISPDYFRIAFPLAEGEYQEQELPAEIEAAVMHAAEVLRQQGAVIVEDVPMPNTKYGIPTYFVISGWRQPPTCTASMASSMDTGQRMRWGGERNVLQDPQPGIWSAAQVADSDGYVRQCGAVQ